MVAAKNEERSTERALTSLVGLDYPDLEVIYVNDRSGDRTGEIADRFSARDGRVKVIHIRELPPGWFGKNHAAWRGAQAASGELLLFTDGDVVFESGAAARGVRHLMREGLDHLCATPQLAVTGMIFQACLIASYWFGGVTVRMWKVRDPKSSAYFGVGAYTLMRAEAYHAIGGHETIALRPDEDVQMGKLVKVSGRRSEVLGGEECLSVAWYHSLREFVSGTEKNAFAVLEYRFERVAAVTLAMGWLGVVPFALAPLLAVNVGGWSALLFAGSVAVCWGTGVLIARQARYSWWAGMAFPLGAMLMIYVLWRSTVPTSTRGVVWGGDPVPLRELRRDVRPGKTF